ncbi:thiol reductant ABC exporter subunit CydD [Saccharopolyspora sp. NPDC002686]|uniref:thiol reductant ABC exporter subunit CydD n=1 Tax=Saccharopolyspora sp. NPDC002686 TaxID=3154541 RepID=UPI00331CE485
MSKRLLRLIARRTRIAVALLALVQAGLIIAQADLLARAIAELDAGYLSWLAGAVALRAVSAWCSSAVVQHAAADLKADLRSALFERAAAQRSSGAFSTLVTKGIDALEPAITGVVPQLALVAVVPPIVLVRLGLVDWPSALITALTIPLIPLFGVLIGLRTKDVTTHQWAHLQRLGGHFRDVLAGLSTLRVFGRAEHQEAVIARMADEHRSATMRALRVAFLSGFVLELVCSLAVALVAVPVGLRLLSGGVDLTTALVVLLLTPEALLPLRALGTRFHAAAEGMAAAEQVFEVLDQPLAERSGTQRVVAGEIRFEDVSVHFPGHEDPVLDRVSFVVRPGERVALVGPSGAGKSTVLHLLLGFVQPTSGRVLVDGVDLRELDLDDWRRQLAWVPQHPHLFAGTIADNIRLGAAGASMAEVQAAAQAAHAAEFIEQHPAGYQAQLGDRAAELSAGQRQRVAIARAYLKNAPIVLLDEPTARLDLHSEAALTASATEVLHDKTAILVAHRPALLSVVDRVIRLCNGSVVEPLEVAR